MKCPYCGKDVVEGNKFCDGCGGSLDNGPAVTASPNAFNYQQNGYQQPKNNKTGLIVTIIIISVLVIAGIIIGIILLTSGGSKNDENNTNNGNNTNNVISNNNYIDDDNDAKLNKNIKVTDYETEGGDIILVVENKNNVDVSIDFNLEYYNESGTVVASDTGYLFALGAGQESVIRMYRTDRAYDNYKVTYETEKADYYTSHQKEIKTSVTEDKEEYEIVVTVTNNSKVELEEVEIGVVFYKNGKVVGFDHDVEYDFAAGKSMALYIDYPYDYNYDDIDFDDYKVYVVEAYEANYGY